MRKRTIDIEETTHERLLHLKKENETISDLIERLVKTHSADYSDLTGILSEKTIRSIKELKEERKR